MDLIHGFRNKHHHKFKSVYKGNLSLSPKSNAHFLIIRLPDSWVLKLVTRTMILALLITALPMLGSLIGGFNSEFYSPNSDAKFAIDSIDMEMLTSLFRDLANEGLLKLGDRALFVGSGNGNEESIYDSQILAGNEMDLISISDSERQVSIPDETFNFAFMPAAYHGAAADFVDRTLKIGGVVAVQLSDDPFFAFQKPSNYKIVYIRRFDSTVIAMRKAVAEGKSLSKRRLCGVAASVEKKAALKNLEDVLLEPPRAASGKSKTYLKQTKYLPDLMGDSLENYSRRVFIDVSTEKGGAGWFKDHYPRRNKDFEMYEVEAVATGDEIGMGEWLRRNVREEEYVVMKAEAEVVEEMVRTGVQGLVDELFLECKHQGLKGKSKKSRRAYWECLALYGRLRDEGVAVHQWWG
ncbi:AP-3 complex subunit mu like [Actinidia chinensis var. chinensis]|uniref:AP-3 complex subunit mu like n=1 Tax=Actinidia chinensis var. chinensis TaxID=1590841 RepID=A0A2R6RNI3_ACTCC|nr:AP-3 complex subunit mu like [Actinidia chinensis var. chinensis]